MLNNPTNKPPTNAVGTQTGRLSSSMANVANVPQSDPRDREPVSLNIAIDVQTSEQLANSRETYNAVLDARIAFIKELSVLQGMDMLQPDFEMQTSIVQGRYEAYLNAIANWKAQISTKQDRS